MTKAQKTEKPKPKRCACGRQPILVSIRGGADAQLPGSCQLPREFSDHVAEDGGAGHGGMECVDGAAKKGWMKA